MCHATKMKFLLVGLLPLASSFVGAPRPRIGRRGAVAMGAMKKIAVGVVGPGLVGSEVLRQIEATKPLLEQQGLDVTVTAISTSKRMICDDADGCTLEDIEGILNDPSGGVDADLEQMAAKLQAAAPHAVMLDTTASEAVSDLYAPWLAAGVHVVTPNKKVGSGDLKRWRACRDAMAATGARMGDETTVGAGLPILGTLRTDLIATGDKVHAIEGIFSGTLSYIFNTFKPGMKFSDVINDAKEKGFTEPDPRDDLNGMDVARKVTILARACGLEVELDAVPIESLVPAALEDWAPEPGEPLADAFVAQMAAFDAEKEALINEADAAGEVLRFVGRVDLDAKKVSVELRKYPKTHPFAGTQYADNICAFQTERYAPQPLVIQGPGAGAAVTAAGIYADFLRIANAC